MIPRGKACALVLLLLILVLAAWVRFYGLGSVGLGLDEDLAVQACLDTLASGLDISKVESRDIYGHFRLMPAAYYLCALSIKYLGLNELGFRLPFFLLGILSVLAVFLLARSIADTPTALIAAFLMAVHPSQVEYAQIARYVVPATVVALLFIWSFRATMERFGWGRLGLCLLLLYLCVRTDLFLVLLIPLCGLWILVAWRRSEAFEMRGREKLIRNMGVVFLVAFAVAALGVLVFAREFANQNLRFVFQEGHLRAYRYAHFLATYMLRMEIPLVIAALFGAWMMIKTRERDGVLISIMAFGPLAVMLVLALFTSARARYLLWTAPLLCMLAAHLIVQAGRTEGRFSRILPPTVLLMLSTVMVFNLYTYYRTWDGRNALPSAIGYINSVADREDVVGYWSGTELPWRLYKLNVPRENLVLLAEQYKTWLPRYYDKRVWIITHTAFDPRHHQFQLLDERCEYVTVIPALTRFTNQWVTIYKREPGIAPAAGTGTDRPT